VQWSSVEEESVTATRLEEVFQNEVVKNTAFQPERPKNSLIQPKKASYKFE
jgi:hypothetical protein